MLRLTRWNPFEEIGEIHRDVERVFGRTEVTNASRSSWIPAAEVTSGSEGWTIRMSLPGIDSKNVSANLDRDVLTISGERISPDDTTKKHLSELRYGSFTRSFTVPDSVDAEKVEAKFKNGMLSLMLPVTESKKSRRIEIAA